MVADPRRAPAASELLDEAGNVRQSGEAEVLIGDEALSAGAVTVSWLDADRLTRFCERCNSRNVEFKEIQCSTRLFRA